MIIILDQKKFLIIKQYDYKIKGKTAYIYYN